LLRDPEGIKGAWILAWRQNDQEERSWIARDLHVVILDSRKAM
jgi:hypothetical protein